MKRIKVGYCLEPKDISSILTLKASPKFIAPATVDLRDYCTPTEDQGQTSKCAAYTAAQYAENINWRLRGYPEQNNPDIIYDYAKKVDGLNVKDGTSLDAVAKALLYFKILEGNESNIKIITNNIEDIKYAIHKYGTVMLAFNISKDWMNLNSNNDSLSILSGSPKIGGHAVLGCGYNRNGIYIQNSWGTSWGSYGFGLIPWTRVEEQYMYGCTITNILNNLN